VNTRSIVSVVVVVVMLVVFGYLVHGVMLASDYAAVPNLYRTADEQARYLPFMMPAHICAAIALVWLYARGRREGSWVVEGLKFGVAVAVLMTVHKFLVYYAVQPLPGATAVKQILFDSTAAILIGLVIARLHR
jgi:hypothetical protein